MKKTFFLLILGISFVITHAQSQIEISGTIDEDSVLSTGSLYILKGNLTVKGNATLTIEKDAEINLSNYKIYIGSTSAGRLEANEAVLFTDKTTSRDIVFRDGSSGNINKCDFTKIEISILNDAGDDITISKNNFTEVDFPVRICPNKVPVFSGNNADNEVLGLEGNLEENADLQLLDWTYALCDNLYIRNNAVLNLENGINLDLLEKTIYVGSTTAGSLTGSNISFFSIYSSERRLEIKDGGIVELSNCSFDNVRIETNDDGDHVILDNCSFSNIILPIKADINCIPDIEACTSTVPIFGIRGTLEKDFTLSPSQWNYQLTGGLNVNNGATLTISENTQIEMNGVNIRIGYSTTPGNLEANQVYFHNSKYNDISIIFQKGGGGSIVDCQLSNVFIDILEDAADSIKIQGNQIDFVTWPVRLNPQRQIIFSNNSCIVEYIFLDGYVRSDCTLELLEWPYAMSGSINIRDGATLSISEGCNLYMKSNSIFVGSSSSSTEKLNINGANIYKLSSSSGGIYFKPGSGGNIQSSHFEGLRMNIDGGIPVIENCRFYHCKTAITVENEGNPTIQNNDFYNNTTAIDNDSETSVDVANNWWGHSSGPIHADNPDGMGESLIGNFDYSPFLTSPVTGNADAILDPESVLFTDLLTGQKAESSFILSNAGDQDLLVCGVETSTAATSVELGDRFWLFPDSSITVPFSFTAMELGITQDTISLNTNDYEEANQEFIIQGEGHIESLVLNFYHIDTDSFPKIKCHFTLNDQAGLPVRAIQKDNLELEEQNQIIEEFEFLSRSANSNLNVSLVFDHSGSMAGADLRNAKSAAIDFVQNLSEIDEACLIGFNSQASLDQEFTNDIELLTNSINSYKAADATAVFDAIDMGIEQVKNRDGIKAVIAFTDGMDNESSTSATAVIAKARSYGIPIYTIGLKGNAEPTLKNIAFETGGQYYFSPTSKELALIYRMISGRLQNLYQIVYNAEETGPFPRIVEILVSFSDFTASDYQYYSIGDSEIDLALAGASSVSGEPFYLGELTSEAINYFYYYINDSGSLIPKDFSFSWYMESGNTSIPMEGKYLGDGIMQYKIDLSRVDMEGNIEISFPDSVDMSGGYLTLKNKPENFTAEVGPYRLQQSVDLFAGASAGAKLLAGAAGAGPSVAAASVSAKGNAGMGMTFERDNSDTEWISRRLEAGVALGVETPEVNTGVDLVQVGASGEISITGTIGQCLAFDITPYNKNLMLKAKAAYVLETISLGTTAASPYLGIVISAVVQSLKVTNPDVMDIYDDLLYSWNLGAAIEGSVGVGFGLNPGKSSSLPKFTFLEASQSIAMRGNMVHYTQADELEFELALATAFNFGLLQAKVGNFNLFNVLGGTEGSEISLSSVFSTKDGFRSMGLGYLHYDGLSLSFDEGFTGQTMDICVPKAVIVEGIDRTGTLINDIYNIFEPPSSGIPDFGLGVDELTNSIEEFFSMQEDTLITPEDHILIQFGENFTTGINIDIGVELDLALGVGAGILLGFNASYFDELWAPTKEYYFAHGTLLPVYESDGVTPFGGIFDYEQEMVDLLNGTIDLVKDGIANLVEAAEYLLELGEDFVISGFDGACDIAGDIYQEGSVWVKKADPRSWFAPEEAFLGRQAKYMYYSSRIGSEGKEWNFKSGNQDDSKLYLVSNVFDICRLDESDNIIDEFHPLRLKMAIDPEMFAGLGFSEGDKGLARIYRFVPETLSWIRMEDDFSTHSDTVSTDFSQSATYAVGIEINSNYDTEPPEILDYWPKDGFEISPDDHIWASVYDGLYGVGIDLARSRIFLDGEEVFTIWDPVNSMLLYRSEGLVEGEHTYRLELYDLNGYFSQITVHFTVKSTGIDIVHNIPGFNANLYPNPFIEKVNIEYTVTSPNEVELSIYDIKGRKISDILRTIPRTGKNELIWDKRLRNGEILQPGVYFLKLSQSGHIEILKMVIR